MGDIKQDIGMIKGYLFKGEHPKTEHTNNDQTETKGSPFGLFTLFK